MERSENVLSYADDAIWRGHIKDIDVRGTSGQKVLG
jgi:hypothetical protein